MPNRVSFVKTCNSIDDLAFENRCSFCNTFTQNIDKNVCFGCNKILQNIRENEILLISYKAYWFFLAERKQDYNLSWYDFLELENSILELTDNLNFLFYDKNNLFFYADISVLSQSVDLAAEAFTKVNKLINTELVNVVKEKSLNHDFYKLFSEINLIDQSNKFMHLVTDESKKFFNVANLSACRKKLMDALKEKFEFNLLKR